MRRDLRVILYSGVAAVAIVALYFSIGQRSSLRSWRLPLTAESFATSTPGSIWSKPAANVALGRPAPDSLYAWQFGYPDTDKEKLAYVTWLSSTVAEKDGQSMNEDVYFIGTRILVWQLLHYGKTKTKGIDVVVLVTPDVSEARRERLRKDGVIVRPIEFVHGKNDKWLHPKEGRWNDIMSKLRVWEMVEYSRVVMLDGDIILQHPLDGIFNDPASQPASTLNNIQPPSDEPELPSEYILSSIGEVASDDHDFPPDWEHGLKKPGYFCAGLFVLKPSLEIFNYYTSLLDIPHRFDPEYMEQNLLNYAHRWDGPMPWKELAYTWNIRSVNDNDLDKGVVSMHEKWWAEPLSGSDRVKAIFLSMRWLMEGYYMARDELRNGTG